MFSILTINAALQDIRFLYCSLYRPIGYIEERLTHLAEEIKRLGSDIVCVQELFHHRLQHRFYSLLQADYPHAAGFAKRGAKLRLGNELMIFSKLPLFAGELTRFRKATLEERVFTSKGMYKVFAEAPAGRLQLINFHLTAGGMRQHPESRDMEVLRTLQMRQLLEYAAAEMPTVLAGDLNAGPEASRTNYEGVLAAGFIDAFAAAGGKGLTWDPENPLVARHQESHLPAQRIDHIFLNPSAASLLRPDSAHIVLNAACIPVDGGNIPVSDHYGVRVDFSINR